MMNSALPSLVEEASSREARREPGCGAQGDRWSRERVAKAGTTARCDSGEADDTAGETGVGTTRREAGVRAEAELGDVDAGAEVDTEDEGEREPEPGPRPRPEVDAVVVMEGVLVLAIVVERAAAEGGGGGG